MIVGNRAIKADLAIVHASQLATPEGHQGIPGPELGHLKIVDDAAVASLKGKIVFAGHMDQFREEVSLIEEARVIQAHGQTILPGFVDSHTHLPFAGFRDEEFLLRISGRTYEEIAKTGGGIKTTVRSTRKMPKEELVAHSLKKLDRMLRNGTTTCEAKSGYGLSLKEEVKQLEVIQEVSRQHPIDVVSTFLGAHAIPDEYLGKREEYLSLLLDQMLPEVSRRQLAEFCDVFCDAYGFTLEESRKILLQAKSHAFQLKIHADQFSSNGGARMAGELGAVSADHLEQISDEDIRFLSKSRTVGVLLPGSVYFLRKKDYPPARRMIEEGMIIALATDFNPGSSMTESLIQIIQLAVFMMDVTVDEAITMATLNGAAAIKRANRIGSIEAGKEADFIVCDIPNRIHLAYHYGRNHCVHVIKKGNVCMNNGQIVY